MISRKWFVEKVCTKNVTIEKPSHLGFFLGFLLTPVFILLYILFAVFQELVRIYLKLKLKHTFDGFVPTTDAIWGMEGKGWSNVVPIILMIKSDTEIDFPNIVRRRIKERVFDVPHIYPKLTSTYETFMGYTYLKPNTYSFDQCVNTIQMNEEKSKYLDQEEISNILIKYAQTPLPLKGTALWEVLPSSKALLQTESNGKKSYIYPLLLRFNHMVGDGASLLAIGSQVYSDSLSEFQHLEKLAEKKKNGLKKVNEGLVKKIVKHVKKLLRNLWIVYIYPGYLIYILYIRKKDKSLLHGEELSGEKHFIYFTESQEELVPLVKKIKQTVPNATFSDVVFTAISASLSTFLKEKNKEVPESFFTAIPVVLSLKDTKNSGRVMLKNNFTMAFTQISYQTPKKSLSDVLDCVQDQFAYLRSNTDLMDGYYFLTNMVLNPFPLPFIAGLPMEGLTCVISCVPTGDRAKVFGGLELDGGMAFTLNRWKTGITFAVVTYDNRFQLGLLLDKALVPDQLDGQKIADNIFVNMKLLAKEKNIAR